ncbi:MAG: triose-phosphate isomerase [Proteobacteria bacterium]|nr:triose-phosphate isomerase [Pseudomonadota bacterium]
MAAKKWVIGNWKLQGSLSSNQALIEGIRARLPALDERVGMAVCPVFPYLPQVGGLIQGSGIELGAQNLSEQAKGAYTGEVAGAMLKEVGAKFVIVGHSERRSYQGEDDALIAKKTRAALDSGLIPVVCLGETKEERDSGETWDILLRQLNAVFDLIDAAKDEVVLAYEPRWAIGTGVSATPEMIADVHGFLRAYLVAKDAAFGARTPILYGGSMNGANAASIAAVKDVDGGLIGSASLKADEFVVIYEALRAAD